MIEQILYPLISERFATIPKYREGHLRVINALPGRKVLGIHSPKMKQAASDINRNGAECHFPDGNVVKCCSGAEVITCFEKVDEASLSMEEIMIWGFIINKQRCSLPHRLSLLSSYIPVLDNWGVCDSFCSNAKWMKKVDKSALWEFLQPYFDSDKEFEVRFAIITSMCYLLDQEWLSKVFRRIDMLNFNKIKSKYTTRKGKPETAGEGTVQGEAPYYVRMGVAWLLATALAKFREETVTFAQNSHLPHDVIKLYIRKARESFRTRDVPAI